MADPFLGEIKLFAGNYAPLGWSFCDGSSLSISENDALYSLIGTTYGGDGINNFNLPDLRGRVPVHTAPKYQLGLMDGKESVVLTSNHLPAHTHPLAATKTVGMESANPSPVNNVLAAGIDGLQMYRQSSPSRPLNAGAVSAVGGAQPHENRQPYIAMNYIIALTGIYPPQN
jgi:microcystin-dependent protein